MPLYEFGSRPSTEYLLLSSISVASAAFGDGDHSTEDALRQVALVGAGLHEMLRISW